MSGEYSHLGGDKAVVRQAHQPGRGQKEKSKVARKKDITVISADMI